MSKMARLCFCLCVMDDGVQPGLTVCNTDHGTGVHIETATIDFKMFTWFMRTLLPVLLWTFCLRTPPPVLLLLLRTLSPVIFSSPTTVLGTREPPVILLRGTMTTSEPTRGVAHGAESSFLGTGPIRPALVLTLLTSL